MNKNLSIKNSHLLEFKSDQMKIPTVFHVSEKLLPDQKTFDQLENLAKDERLFHHIAAMSDVHPKKGRKNPTGTIVASKKHLFPQINDTAPNCGMRFIRTDLDETSLSTEKINALFKELVEVIPTKKYLGTKISFKDVLEICKYGSRPLQEKFQTRTKNEIENTFERGNLMTKENVSDEDIFSSIPKLFLHTAKYRTGILGAAGNHFLDLMKITEIKNNEIAQKFNLRVGQYIFLLHTGSGLIGQYASYMYTPKKKEHLSQQIMFKLGTAFLSAETQKIYKGIERKIREYENKDEFLGYDADSVEGRMYLTAHEAAGNFGFANRLVLNHHLDHALEKVLGRQVDLDLLYDMPHIMNRKETHFGENVWVHRNGTVRANGPERMKGHSLFEQTGEPVFIPSSMSTPAYLGVGTNENESSFFSASHGTGRRAKVEDESPKDKEELFKNMEKAQVRLYNAASSGVILQDSSYYKDVEEVISGMEDNKIINAAVKMQPVAVLMY
ncbi:MAG: RtcB family protein [Candidatus Moranbacteria bacterium]|nr:RtcB family protein [Candidatus Moranbacteria bacterium]